jgi:hypothetical protein
MYLTEANVYYVGSEMRIGRAPFLILVQSKNKELGPNNFRALVRKVAMRQRGHWMMGRARVKGKTITLSGAYGSDGLPIGVDEEVYDAGIDVPKELYDVWDKGGGWNSCGSEAYSMRDWAVETFLKKSKGK